MEHGGLAPPYHVTHVARSTQYFLYRTAPPHCRMIVQVALQNTHKEQSFSQFLSEKLDRMQNTHWQSGGEEGSQPEPEVDLGDQGETGTRPSEGEAGTRPSEGEAGTRPPHEGEAGTRPLSRCDGTMPLTRCDRSMAPHTGKEHTVREIPKLTRHIKLKEKME